MKWIHKIKNYLSLDEEAIEEQFIDIEKDQPPLNNSNAEEKKKSFRFPLIPDDNVEPTKTTEQATVQQEYTYEEKGLQLPRHLQQQKDVYDVEVSGIRDLLERRRKDKGYSKVIRSSGEEMIYKQVTEEEKSYLKVDEAKGTVDQKFISTLENKKRFVPTDVPSPVYGFQKPKEIQTLLNDRRHQKDEWQITQSKELQQTESVVDDIAITEQLPTMHEPTATQAHILHQRVINEQIVEDTTNEVLEEPVSEQLERVPLAEETVIEEEIVQQAVEETKLEEKLAVEEQSVENTEQPSIVAQQETVQLEPSVQHVTIENSTIHIAQMHVEQMPMQQPQADVAATVEDLSINQDEQQFKPVATRSRLPFNVLMLKSDKQKLAAKQMIEQFKYVAKKQPLVEKTEEQQLTAVELENTVIEVQQIVALEEPLKSEYVEEVIPATQSVEGTLEEPATERLEAELVEQEGMTAQQLLYNQMTEELSATTQEEVEEQLQPLPVEQVEPERQLVDDEVSANDEVVEEEVIDTPVQFSKQVEITAPIITEQVLVEVDENEEAAGHSPFRPQTQIVEKEQSQPVVEIKEVLPYVKPPLEILTPPEEKLEDREWMDEQGDRLVEALSYFQVQAQVESIVQGPAVTQFEITVGHGTKVSKVRNLSDDIKLALAARDIRIDAPIPGKRSIGIEIPNRLSRAVRLSEVTDSEAFQDSDSPLEAALGLDLTGKPVTLDLRKMPHGLIAGATGSGKSVCINSILVSLLYKAAPHELKLMLIDPKMVELAPFNDIPHLVSPVITDVKAATAALKWAVEEMERRYQLFMHANVRDIARFNKLATANGQYAQKLPYLLIVIDELADLMMMSPADVEEAICRIAQKARACGIHLIVATQRPSVDVITGLIKSNIPTRIAFAVSSQIDSRTIIDSQGAERLLGRGDMLYLGNGSSAPIRIQGTFVTDEEIEEVVQYVRQQGEPEYIFKQEELLKKTEMIEEQDELFEDVCRFVFEQGTASTSSIQRRYHIGYNRAARLVDMLERQGYVSEQKGSKARDVFITETELQEIFG